MTKNGCLKEAIEITKEWCRGGSQGNPASVLQSLYEKLLELNKDANSD